MSSSSFSSSSYRTRLFVSLKIKIGRTKRTNYDWLKMFLLSPDKNFTTGPPIPRHQIAKPIFYFLQNLWSITNVSLFFRALNQGAEYYLMTSNFTLIKQKSRQNILFSAHSLVDEVGWDVVLLSLSHQRGPHPRGVVFPTFRHFCWASATDYILFECTKNAFIPQSC